jgi:hypothetical protein
VAVSGEGVGAQGQAAWTSAGEGAESTFDRLIGEALGRGSADPHGEARAAGDDGEATARGGPSDLVGCGRRRIYRREVTIREKIGRGAKRSSRSGLKVMNMAQ